MKKKMKKKRAAFIASILTIAGIIAVGFSNASLLPNEIYAGAVDEESGTVVTEAESVTEPPETENEFAATVSEIDDTTSDEEILSGEELLEADAPAVTNTITINSSEDLINYSVNYSNDPAAYQNMDVSFAITSGDLSDLSGFVSIGTYAYPFAADLIVASSTDLSFTLDKPLFAYIMDSAQIVDSSGNDAGVTITRTGTADSALFAENVIHDIAAAAPADWRITVGANSDDNSFAGVLGTIGGSAAVKLTVNSGLSSASSVAGSGDVGLACCQMAESSSLEVALTGSNAAYSVTSSAGNAGGLVGTMKSGSGFTLGSGFDYTGNVTSGVYAGGLVGYAENVAVNFGGNSKVSGTVCGVSGTGGIFGYYKNTNENHSFDISAYGVNCTLNGDIAGGLIGRLENSGNMVIDGSSGNTISIRKTASEKYDIGGILGTYISDAAGNSLTVSNVSVTVDNASGSAKSFGGFISWVKADAYLRFENVTASARGCNSNLDNFGGLVGYSEKAFVDAENITVGTNGEYWGGGVIGNMNSGVLRLSGTTDLSGTKAAKGGQIVGTRGSRALIYAKDGWQLIRSAEAAAFDDIGSWGSVLRLLPSLSESDVFTVDETAHTVAVKGADTSVNSLADFVKLALNIQMNSGIASEGRLSFENTASTCSVLLDSDISINCNIDLTGTGLTGLTRDDGKAAGGGSCIPYTGTFNGNGHTITLADGEPYGYRGSISSPITADDTSDGNGCIHRHYYNTLLAQTGNGAKFCDLTIDGIINVSCKDNSNYFFGGAAGSHINGELTAENVTVKEQIRIGGTGGNYLFVGGFIGKCGENSNPVVSLNSCVFSPEISYNNSAKAICGGAFCEIGATPSLTVTADNVTVGGSIINNSTADFHRTGGFIGNISNYNGTSGVRTLSVKNMTFDGASVETAWGGALLGEAWNDTEVTVGSETEKGITVKNSSVINSRNGGFAGLMTAASGYWKVYDIEIESIDVDGGTANSFGMLINKGICTDNSRTYALYLELAKENAYRITSADMSGLNANAVYDDIAATCTGKYDGDTLLENGKSAVISVHTSGGAVVMDGTGCNTYQNQTSVIKANPNTRYYYNLDVIRAKNSSELTSSEKLMLWSVNKYSYENIKKYFPEEFGSTVPAGDYDMTGYSYYPIDAPDAVTFVGGSSFTFCNDRIEAGENGAGNSDNMARSTLSADSQHYLMHFGLFRNVNTNINASGGLTYKGSVGGNSEYSGAFLCGTLMGSSAEPIKFQIDGIVLDGIRVNGNTSQTGYAPLLVNRIDSFTDFSLKNVSTSDGYGTSGTAVAATGLIGDVGNAGGTSSDIRLTFSALTLDGRKSALSDSIANNSLNSAYNTDRSIFSKAVLLNSFKFKTGSNCSGSYNFKFDEDWNNDLTPKHMVAYGSEISDSAEYNGLQEKYIKSDTYTDPTRPDPDSEYTFKNSFLPYVATVYTVGGDFHEIKVNQSIQADLDTGCGTYNDPYIISYGRQLELLDKVLSGNLGVSEDGTVINYMKDNYKVWCADRIGHTTLIWNSGSSLFVSEDSTVSVSLSEMQRELATAYYKLSEDIAITSSDFVGIGKNVPFKGVIFGNGKTIESSSAKPLIYQSTGAVVKDLTLNITTDFSGQFGTDAADKYETDSNGTTVFYGGLIGIVNGGDNIIDNVGISFSNAGSINIKSGSCYGNKAVGGYIGVVRYGGVIFRNMDSVAPELRAGITGSANSMFNSTGNFKDSSNKVLLYCNPIIGRVIDGYAVTEANSYNGDEANVTMHNGTKNYSIADIDKNAGRMSFSAFEHPIGKNNINSATVYVNDAQQLFLLGCISMSGSGSASSAGGYSAAYSYGNGQMMRHADYSEIGTDSTADFGIASTDSFANNNVPYIIYKYTEQNVSGAYPAKNITNNSFVFNIEMTQGTYDMPDGFRGIGSMNSSSSDLVMFINGINGNNSTIELNMNFYMYKFDYDKYYINNNNNLNTFKSYKVGLGLFNTLVQNKSDVTPADFASDTSGKYTISDIVISGNVNYEVYESESRSAGYNKNSYFSVAGGLAGASITSNLMTDNVTMSDLTVNARFISGGLIGSAAGSGGNYTVRVNNFGADGLNVGGGALSGGLIAYARDVILEADGNTNGEDNCTFRIGTISSQYNSGGFDSDNGVGGLIGTVHSQNRNADYSVAVRNVDIEGGLVVGGDNSTFVGGVIGCCGDKNNKMTAVNITDASLNGVDVNKGSTSKIYCGGVIGTIKRSVADTQLYNVHMTGTGGGNYVEGRSQAGGIVGLTINNLAIDNCSMENYTVRSTETDIKIEGVGGFLAKGENYATVYLKNSSLKNCVLQCSTKMQVGSVAGSVVDNAKLYGYNIVIDDVRVTDPNGGTLTSDISGDIAGYVKSGSELKLVGVCMQKNPGGKYIGKNIGKNEGACYVIYADFTGSCLDEAAANKEASSVNRKTVVDDIGSYPYVTVNPKTVIDSTQFLTGDGADKAAVDFILSDIGNVTGYNNIVDEYNDKFLQYESKRSAFNERTGASIPNDIPILVINDSNYRNVTEMLNSYIHILTNDVSVANYAQADSSICNVDIIPLRLNESNGVFETGDSLAKTLEYRNGYFRMTNLDYDSNYEQFTLIDIQYYDPYTAGKIAYHLYIPVYVEKMLDFDFRAAVLSGTTYNVSFYTDGHPVLENYGNPVTAYVTYSYKRTADEWQNVINSGENLLSNYGKSVLLKSKNDLPADTRLVLVDRNNYSRPYYSTIGEAFNSSDDKLDFGRFAASDGTLFAPVTFCDLLSKLADITVSEDADGNLVKCTADEIANAAVIIGGEYYRKKTDSDADTTTLYSAVLTPKSGMIDSATGFLKVEEDYYISFFTKTDNDAPMRNITLTCGKRLADTNMTPSHLDNENAKESMVHMILGNLYDQTFSFKSTGSEVINDSNRSLNAQLKTVISLKPDNAAEVKPYLNDDSIHLYHGFIIEATRSDESATEKGVKGNPRITGTYKIGAAEYNQNFSNPDSSIILTSNTADIKAQLISSSSVTISCDDLLITYSDEESIIAQFPERKNQNETYGVTLSASSNLAYVQDNIEQSNMSEEKNDENGKFYYRENIEAASLSYNIPQNSPNELTKLGINGNDINDKITAVGYYNVLNIPEAVFDRARKVKFTLSLYQKQNGGSYTAVDIDDYLEDAALYDKNGSAKSYTENNGSYEFLFDKENELNFEAGSFEIITSYSVITGAELEGAGKLYSNYKVQLTAMLLDENGEPIENSGCSDHIVYTNARIYSQMIPSA